MAALSVTGGMSEEEFGMGDRIEGNEENSLLFFFFLCCITLGK